MATTPRGRNTIIHRIALDGGEEIRKELEALGPAGEKAFRQLKAAVDRASTTTALNRTLRNIRLDLDAIRASGARLVQSFNTMGIALRTFDAALFRMTKRIGVFAGGLGLASAGMLKLISSTSDHAVEIDKQAKALGLTNRQYQLLQRVAKQTEIDQGSFERIMARFSLTVDEAGDNTEKAAGFQSDLQKQLKGVADESIKVVRGYQDMAKESKTVGGATKSNFDSLLQYARGLKALGDEHKAFDKVAADFSKRIALDTTPFLLALADAFDTTGAASSKMLEPLTDAEIALGLAFDNAFDDLKINAETAKERLSSLFSPAIIAGFIELNRIIVDNFGSIEEATKEVAIAAEQLVKDVFNVIKRNDAAVENKSLIAFRDAIIGIGTTVKFVFYSIVIPAFTAITSVLDVVAFAFNSVFGTELTGTGLLVAAIVLKISGAFTVLSASLGVVLASWQLFKDAVLLLANVLFRLLIPGVVLLGKALIGIVAGIAGFLGLPVLLVAGILVAIGLLVAGIIIYWDEIKAAGIAAFEFVSEAASDALEGIKAQFAEGGSANILFQSYVNDADRAWEFIKSSASETWEFLSSGFGDVSSSASDAWAVVEAGAASAFGEIENIFSGDLTTIWINLGNAAASAWEIVKSGAASAWETILSGLTQLSIDLAPGWQLVKDGASSLWSDLSSLATKAWQGVVDIVIGAAKDIAEGVALVAKAVLEAWSGASQDIAESAKVIVDAINEATNIAGNVEGAAALAAALVEPFEKARLDIDDIWAGLDAMIRAGFNSLASYIKSVASDITSMIRSIINALERAASAARKLKAEAGGSSSNAAQGLASGGLVWGPGTTTSDSILARLSRGEFVINAAAVKHYGMAFFDMLNRFKISKNFIPKFRFGGIVSSLQQSFDGLKVPAFAGGGSVALERSGIGASGSFSLTIDGKTFSGLTIPIDVAKEMEAWSIGKKIRSARKSPTRSRI